MQLFRDPIFGRFVKVPACDRQTDKRTNGRTDVHCPHDDSILYRASIASRGKNKPTKSMQIHNST